MSKLQFIRSRSLLWVGVYAAGFMGGCGSWSQSPVDRAEAEKTIKEYRKGIHQQLKADAKKSNEDMAKNASMRRGARRGTTGR